MSRSYKRVPCCKDHNRGIKKSAKLLLEDAIMDERIEVYETLRNEIIAMEEIQRNVWIYMYVLFCTLFVLGLQWSEYLFLVSYIILIPFQYVINDYKWSISRMSTYIRIFFEKNNKDISWESLQVSECYKEYDRRKRKSIKTVVGMSGAVHLGILATGFYCGYTLKNSYIDHGFILDFGSVILIILSIILLMILITINRQYYRNYDTELEDVISKYKKEKENLQGKSV